MPDEVFEDDDEATPEPDLVEAEIDEDDLDDDALDDDLDELDVDADVPVDVVVDLAVDPAAVPADDVPAGEGTTAADPAARAAGNDDDEEALELDEELHPDDVETPLDALLEEKTAAATMEDDEEDVEEDEPEGDDRGEGPAKIVPRRPGEFVCRSCFLVLPRHQLADEERMLCRDCA
jgi:hypothetical protein